MSRPVTIKLDGTRRGGTVEIDGHDISAAITAVRVDAEASRMPRVTVDVASFSTTIDGTATIGIPQRTHDALVALGWTPPGGEP